MSILSCCNTFTAKIYCTVAYSEREVLRELSVDNWVKMIWLQRLQLNCTIDWNKITAFFYGPIYIGLELGKKCFASSWKFVYSAHGCRRCITMRHVNQNSCTYWNLCV